METPTQLHSERHGRARALSADDLVSLVWGRIVRARDRYWLFHGSLIEYRGLEPKPTAPRIADAEEYFTMRLRRSGIGSNLVAGTSVPHALEFVFTPEAERKDLLFDIVELLHAEIVAKPLFLDKEHGGMEIDGFDKDAGQALFREELNEVLALASPPVEILPSGQTVERDEVHRDLYIEPVPEDTEAEIRDPVEAAISQFLHRGATVQDQRSAVKNLADALEHLRPEVRQETLREDERMLFRLANEFAIRHNRRDQRGDYNKPVWLRWAFHVYLATIRAVLAVRDRQEPDTKAG